MMIIFLKFFNILEMQQKVKLQSPLANLRTLCIQQESVTKREVAKYTYHIGCFLIVQFIKCSLETFLQLFCIQK